MIVWCRTLSRARGSTTDQNGQLMNITFCFQRIRPRVYPGKVYIYICRVLFAVLNDLAICSAAFVPGLVNLPNAGVECLSEVAHTVVAEHRECLDSEIDHKAAIEVKASLVYVGERSLPAV